MASRHQSYAPRRRPNNTVSKPKFTQNQQSQQPVKQNQQNQQPSQQRQQNPKRKQSGSQNQNFNVSVPSIKPNSNGFTLPSDKSDVRHNARNSFFVGALLNALKTSLLNGDGDLQFITLNSGGDYAIKLDIDILINKEIEKFFKKTPAVFTGRVEDPNPSVAVLSKQISELKAQLQQRDNSLKLDSTTSGATFT